MIIKQFKHLQVSLPIIEGETRNKRMREIFFKCMINNFLFYLRGPTEIDPTITCHMTLFSKVNAVMQIMVRSTERFGSVFLCLKF
jgi:hypothetical protein